MDLERARESLRAAALCLREGCANAAANRAYYAMFQAAQVALEHAGLRRARWSHHGLQATFTTELIQRRKIYPASMRNHLVSGLEIRHTADYEPAGVSQKTAQRLLQKAMAFVSAVEEVTSHGTTS
jgi:uncharacterized protein (UPF0332 family)